MSLLTGFGADHPPNGAGHSDSLAAVMLGTAAVAGTGTLMPFANGTAHHLPPPIDHRTIRLRRGVLPSPGARDELAAELAATNAEFWDEWERRHPERGGRDRAKANHHGARGRGEPGEEAEREARRFKLVAFRDVKALRSAAYLARGILPREGLCVVWGPPKCGKTFWLLDLVLHVALGWFYRGRRVAQGPVVYVACEGERGLGARVEAWHIKHVAELPSAEPVPFWLVTTRLDLVAEWQTLISDIRDQIGDVQPAAIVIDTLNRSIAGSESRDEDMSDYIKAADAVREAFKCLVIPVHHCGLDGTRPRGHTSLLGAADAQIAIKHPDAAAVVATVEYMKDGEAGAEVASRLELVELGHDEDGEMITSLVVELSNEQPTPPSQDKEDHHPKGAARTALRYLADLISAEGTPLPPGNGFPPRHLPPILGVPMKRWREECLRRGISSAVTANGRSRAITTAIDDLTESQRVGQCEFTVWIPHSDPVQP